MPALGEGNDCAAAGDDAAATTQIAAVGRDTPPVQDDFERRVRGWCSDPQRGSAVDALLGNAARVRAHFERRRGGSK